jgi:hypothetical protein
MDNVLICVISGQRLAELLQRPVRCGMVCHVVMHDPARPDFHDHEYLEHRRQLELLGKHPSQQPHDSILL